MENKFLDRLKKIFCMMNYFKLKTLCLLEESRLYILDTSPENSKYLHKCQAIPYLEQDSRIEFHNL